MSNNFPSLLYVLRGSCAALLVMALAACASPEAKVAWGVGSVTALLARAPTNEIEQIYYLGVFDPREQVPPMIYRIRVHGQSSFISGMEFASGWVPAGIADSLGGKIAFKEDGSGLKITKAKTEVAASIATGRKLMMFGPEGFRKAPDDHRLVIVMGSNPAAYFEAVDQTIGDVSTFLGKERRAELTTKLFKALIETKHERERLEDLLRRATAAAGE